MSPLAAQVVLAVLNALADVCSGARTQCLNMAAAHDDTCPELWLEAAAGWFGDIIAIQAAALAFEHEVAQDWEWQGGERGVDFTPHGGVVYRYDRASAYPAQLAALDDDDADHDGLFAAPWPQK